jgi:rhodanese-related sulfurtransferase
MDITAPSADVDSDLAAVKAAKVPERASMVRQVPAAGPARAEAHFTLRLEVETDPSDVHADLLAGHPGVVVLDVRPPEAYERSHVPGARSVPYRTIDDQLAATLSADSVHVVYCWGPGCNAASRAGLRLARLGIPVKEMIGGLEYWRREGYPLAAGQEPGSL